MRITGRLTPEQFWARMTAMEDDVRAQAHLLPLYGLTDWPGERILGEWGHMDGRLTTAGLLHGEFDNGDGAEGTRVQVMVDTRAPREVVQNLRLTGASPFDKEAALAARQQAGSPPTGTVTIPVNGDSEVFDHWVDGSTWYAARQHHGHALVIEARNVRPDELALVTVDDIEPYLAGRRAWLRHKRGED